MDTIPELLSVSEFHTMTGNKFASDSRVASTLQGVAQAVRNYCGWHIAPIATCKAYLTGDGGAVLPLPSLAVSAVAKVSENGIELDPCCYQFKRLGFIRKDSPWCEGWDSIEVVFSSGFDDAAAIKSIVCQIASNNLAAPAGVREEHAGNVGIAYNQTASGVSGGITLLERDKEVLAPFRRVV